MVNSCGFCLASGSLCSIWLKRRQGWKVGMQIDIQNSCWQHNNQVQLSLTSFAKSINSSPCTNIPIMCSLCPATSDAMWKYNLEMHLKTVHPTANASDYCALYKVKKSKFIALKNLFNSKPWWTTRHICNLGNISILEAHSSHIAVRYANLFDGRFGCSCYGASSCSFILLEQTQLYGPSSWSW